MHKLYLCLPWFYLPICIVMVLITEVSFWTCVHVCLSICMHIYIYISSVPIGQISMKSDTEDFCAICQDTPNLV